MNTPSEFELRAAPRGLASLQQVLATSLAQEAHDVVRHLARVLDVQKDEQVLLIPGDGVLSALTLVNDVGCHVSVLTTPGEELSVQPADERIVLQSGSLTALPFEVGTFDAA